MRYENFDINKVIEALEGTSLSITDAIQSVCDENGNFLYPEMTEFDLTGGEHDAIANRLFECWECGTWYDWSKNAAMNGRTVYAPRGEEWCEDCLPEEEDEE